MVSLTMEWVFESAQTFPKKATHSSTWVAQFWAKFTRVYQSLLSIGSPSFGNMSLRQVSSDILLDRLLTLPSAKTTFRTLCGDCTVKLLQQLAPLGHCPNGFEIGRI